MLNPHQPSPNTSSLITLQLGMGWLPEKAGGLNRVYYNCIRHLPPLGVQVHGLVASSKKVFQDSGGIVQSFASSDAPLWQRWIGARQAVQQVLNENTIALVASHFSLYSLPVLNQLGDRPLVVHFHGPWALEGGVENGKKAGIWCKKMIEQSTYRQATAFIVLSQAFRTVLHQEYGVPLEQIHIVPGGVELADFNIPLSPMEARKTLGWPCDRAIIFTARRLAKRMGLENLIAAINQVRRRYPDILLFIAGGGDLAPTLQQQIESLDLTNHVHLLGYVPDYHLALAYRAADFSVVPTVALEGFGLVVVESLAAGTPVLGTPIGGIPEILRPLSEDLVLEGATIDHLAGGISEVLSGQRHLPNHDDCLDYVRTHYAWPVVAEQIKSVYQAVLDGKG
jgi:glycosyltransferase involved in cell wall biosynthesis